MEPCQASWILLTRVFSDPRNGDASMPTRLLIPFQSASRLLSLRARCSLTRASFRRHQVRWVIVCYYFFPLPPAFVVCCLRVGHYFYVVSGSGWLFSVTCDKPMVMRCWVTTLQFTTIAFVCVLRRVVTVTVCSTYPIWISWYSNTSSFALTLRLQPNR